MAPRKKPLKLLAIDTSGSPGYAVFELLDGKAKLVYVNSVKTDTGHSDAERYAIVEAKTVQVIHEAGPFDLVCREHFTSGRNKRSTQLVFGAWAAVDTALGKFGYVINEKENEITPSFVKIAACNDGSGSKKDVEDGIRIRLSLDPAFVFRNDDESDAAAIGYAYLVSSKRIEPTVPILDAKARKKRGSAKTKE